MQSMKQNRHLISFRKSATKKGQAASWATLTGIYGERSLPSRILSKRKNATQRPRNSGYEESFKLNLMEIYIQTGRYDDAAIIASESVQNCLKDSNVDCQAHGFLSLSEAKRLSGDARAARAALEKARPLALKSQTSIFAVAFFMRTRVN